jgi:hypothetical protein
MANKYNYRVFPDEPSPVQNIELSSREVEGLDFDSGCFTWGGIVIVVTVIVNYLFSDSGLMQLMSMFIGILIASVIIAAIHYAKKVSKTVDLQYQANYRAKIAEEARVANEANALTSTLRDIYESSCHLASELDKHLRQTKSYLRHAEEEYNDNAFAPFWDAIEGAARSLADHNKNVKQLSKNAELYYKSLQGRRHTFPSFPVQPEMLPNVLPVLNEFRRVVRLGQTNFQFAQIWEHYKDRQVMMAGFRYFGEAINNLRGTVEHSISDLRASVSSSLAKSIIEEINTRDVIADAGERLNERLLEQNRMLDNIQHERKPKY